MTFGFSRDDAGKFLDAYYDNKIFENDPFAKLDQTGVGTLVEMAVRAGPQRPVRSMQLGICGEHGGDPISVEFCHNGWAWTMSPAAPSACPSPVSPPRRPRSARAGNPGLPL